MFLAMEFVSSDDEDLRGDGKNMNDELKKKKNKDDKQLLFVTLLKDYKVIFDKSQKPEAKVKKLEAVNSFQKLLALNTGKETEKNKLLKKISNTKKLIKEKSDKNRTGNQKIKLNL